MPIERCKLAIVYSIEIANQTAMLWSKVNLQLKSRQNTMFSQIIWFQKHYFSLAIACPPLRGVYPLLRRAILLLLFSVNAQVFAAGASDRATQSQSSRLDTIRDKRYLICGISGKLPGFSLKL